MKRLLVSIFAVVACNGDATMTPPPGSAPTLTAAEPAAIATGSPATQVALQGMDFAADAVVLWDGMDRPTLPGGSATAIAIEIDATDLALPAPHELRVINPNGGISTAVLVVVRDPNPVPALDALVPNHIVVGSAGFELELVGSGFAHGAKASVGGVPRASTPVDETHLTIALDASELAEIGALAITVTNPGPGGGTSAARTFAVTPPAQPSGVLLRASLGDAGELNTFGSQAGPVSADGRYIVFASYDTVIAGDTNSRGDVFLRDTCAGATSCSPSTVPISVSTAGAYGTSADATLAAATPDLRYIVFNGSKSLAAGAQLQALFVRDTCLGATGACTPTTTVGTPGFTLFTFDISDDGRYIAYATIQNLVAADSGSSVDVYVRDTCLGATSCTPGDTLISIGTNGISGTASSGLAGGYPSISADGRFVAFESDATNLIVGDTNASVDVFVRDTCLGATGACTPTTIRASVDAAGNSPAASHRPSLDNSGRYVTFYSASPLVAGANGQNVYVRDTCLGVTGACTPTTTLVSVRENGTAATNATTAGPAAISGDGRYIAFAATDDGIVAADTNGFADMFVRDTCAGVGACTPTTHWVSTGPGGVAPDGSAFKGGLWLSPDARFCTFDAAATNLVSNDTNGQDDVFLSSTGF